MPQLRGLRSSKVQRWDDGSDTDDDAPRIPGMPLLSHAEAPKTLLILAFILSFVVCLGFKLSGSMALMTFESLITATATPSEHFGSGVIIYAYENPGCAGPVAKLTTRGMGCEAVRHGTTVLYGNFTCAAMSAGVLIGCRDPTCINCTRYNLRPKGECGGALDFVGSAKFECASSQFLTK